MSKDLKSIVNTVGDLPAMPVVAVKVMELLQDSHASTEALANAISLDRRCKAVCVNGLGFGVGFQ